VESAARLVEQPLLLERSEVRRDVAAERLARHEGKLEGAALQVVDEDERVLRIDERLFRRGAYVVVAVWPINVVCLLAGATKMRPVPFFVLNITGTIYLAGTFICVIGGLYWKRANTSGGYLAMLMGAAGAIIPFFFLHWSENITGLCAFGLATLGLVLGSLMGKRAPTSSTGVSLESTL